MKSISCFALCIAAAFFTFAQPAPAQEQGPALELREPLEAGIGGVEVHDYRVELRSEEFMLAVVDQRDIDLAVTVFGPDGAAIREKVGRRSR